VRARTPDHRGFAERDGVKLAFEVFDSSDGDGAGRATVVLAPTWSIIRSRFWKAQIPYLARHYRVVAFDGRGSGASDRPEGASAHTPAQYAEDIVAVMDATGTDRAAVVALSAGAWASVLAAAAHPDRVEGLVLIGPSCGLRDAGTGRVMQIWDERLPTTEGWAKYNRHHWLEGGYGDFVGFFFRQMFSEWHSTKQIEDTVGWALENDPATVVDTVNGREGLDGAVVAPIEEACPDLRCPVLVIHGAGDRIVPLAAAERLAELTGGSLVTLVGSGHGPMSRDPVQVNHLVRRFVDGVHPPPPRRTTWTRASRRPRRALYLSSPIGLGHARRDLAIATELRALQPDLEIDWLAQHPVTAVLERAGERVHPASAWLASESAHIEDECQDHDLHAFQAIRRMDEILVNNFMAFSDLVDEQHYDVVIADEAWEVDHFLHENPELKRFPFVWMTDFVGWLPMPEGGDAEAALTADYNAEMLEQRARFRSLRDRSIFVGNPDDVVPGTFGPGLPGIREWTEANFAFAGYVTGFGPGDPGDPGAPGGPGDLHDDAARAARRAALGYHPDERVCVVTVGGSGVGGPLLRRVLDAVPTVRRQVGDDVRFVVVTGPRVDPRSLPQPPPDGVELRGFVPDLHHHLAVCDLAIVQGGLTTCMELTAHRRPFVYVPLRNHFEQNFHVRHRLDRYGAGRCLPYDELDPDHLAAVVAAEIARPVDYAPVETDGARRAAGLVHELL